MWWTRVLAFVVLAACGDGTATLPGSNTQSLVLANLSQVRQPDPRGAFLRAVENESYDDRLRAAAFLVVKDMSRAEAVATLVDDGFTCAEAACNTVVIERETWAALTFGVRSPGPKRVFTYTYRVAVLGDEVSSMSDLAASVEVETQERDGNG
jgi:hypothetical protein